MKKLLTFILQVYGTFILIFGALLSFVGAVFTFSQKDYLLFTILLIIGIICSIVIIHRCLKNPNWF